ncbi:sporulation protein [Microbacteriaceae bacterium 4G12]
MFRRLLAKLGREYVKLGFTLQTDVYKQGDTVQGELRLTGSATEKQLEYVRVGLYMTFITMKGREYTKEIAAFFRQENFSVGTDEQQLLPFTYHVPFNLAVSSTQITYTVRVALKEKGQEEIVQSQLIEIIPHVCIGNVIDAFVSLDFQKTPSFGTFTVRVQTFTLIPIGYFTSMLDKVEFTLSWNEKEMTLLLCIFGKNDQKMYHRVMLSHWELEDVEELAERLRKEITDMCNEPHVYKDKEMLYADEGDFIGSFVAGLFPEIIFDE